MSSLRLAIFTKEGLTRGSNSGPFDPKLNPISHLAKEPIPRIDAIQGWMKRIEIRTKFIFQEKKYLNE